MVVFGAMVLAGCAGRPAGSGLDVARAALAGGDPGVALRVGGEVLARHPRDGAALVVTGEALAALGRVGPAVARLREAVVVRPRDWGARMELGRLLARRDPGAAAAQFRAVVAARAGDWVAWNDLGVVRDLQGRHRAARVAYRAALAARPGFRAARVNLAVSLALDGRAAEAARIMQLVGPGASGRVRADWAAVMAMAGHPGAARRMLTGAMPPEEVAAAVRAYAALGGT